MNEIPDVYQEIAEATDVATARKIAALFQGCQIYFPYWHGRAHKRIERDRAIVSGKNQGKTCAELAKEFGLTERRVEQVVKAARQEQRKLPM